MGIRVCNFSMLMPRQFWRNQRNQLSIIQVPLDANTSARMTLSKLTFSVTTVVAFYSFGAFGFFNLFGMATVIKICVVLYSVFGVLSLLELGILKGRRRSVVVLTLFFYIYYGFFLTISKGSLLLGLVNSWMMWVFTLYILLADRKIVALISRSVVILSGLSGLLGLFVFVIYAVYPEVINIDSFELMSSETGNKTIAVASIYDYFSFTSGDGFSLFDLQVTRVKGYSNEPSATLVHYLAPAAIGLLLGKLYRSISILLLFFCAICVSSMLGIISILLSFGFYLLLSIKSHHIRSSVSIVGLVLILLLLSDAEYLISNIMGFGQDIYSASGYDLIARKEGSATARLVSHSDAISSILNHPMGGAGQNTTSGLVMQLGLVGGLPLILIVLYFSSSVYRRCSLVFRKACTFRVRFSVSFILSLFFTFTIFSGYGWDRVSGVIMIILLYRNLEAEVLYEDGTGNVNTQIIKKNLSIS